MKLQTIRHELKVPTRLQPGAQQDLSKLQTLRHGPKKTGGKIVWAIMICAWASQAQAGVLGDLIDWLTGNSPAPSRRDTPPVAPPPPNLFPTLPTLGFAAAARDLRIKENGGVAELTVERTNNGGLENDGSLNSITVKFTTQSDLAQAGEDFKSTEGLLRFKPGETRATVRIELIDDTQHEADETFLVILSEPRNSRLDAGVSVARVIIDDDDPAPPPPPPPARLVIVPETLDFGHVLVGQTRQKEITVRNDGGGAGRVPPSVIIADDGSETFRLSGPGCAGRELVPGADCRMEIMFTPPADGRFAATLSASTVGDPSATRGATGSVATRGATGSVATLVSDPAAWASFSARISGRGRLPKITEDPLGARITMLRMRRRGERPKIGSTEITPDPLREKPQWERRDKNYKKLGVRQVHWTLPVDRSRIIDIHRHIPCVLGDTINSQVPGVVHCQVERNVYGDDGRLVLIEAGTKVFGDYESLAQAGDTRLNIVWRRMTRPDGSSVVIPDGGQAADVAGRTAIPGYIDARFWERYGSALLITGITVGAGLVIPSENERFGAAYESLTEQGGQITTEMLERNLDLRPVMTVPWGTRLIIVPLVDLWFPTARRIEVVPGSSVSR